MPEALTRIPPADLASKVLTSLTSSGTSLVFHYSDGSTHSEDMTAYLDQLLTSVDNTIVSNIASLVSTSSLLNPPSGTEKLGDIRVASNIASMYVNGAWLQMWPIL